MRLYMYELELWLNEHKKSIFDISFQSDEANTDRPLKEFLKEVIVHHCNGLAKLRRISVISVDGKLYNVTKKKKKTYIKQVLLSEDIPQSIKELLKNRKNAVFTNPDLCLLINIDNNIEYETIELKSTKNNSIPGSSIQQIIPEEWVIFIKHTAKDIEVTTGQYVYAINSKMQFPDRSPRPQVSFKELQNWNLRCRSIDNNSIMYKFIGDETEKYSLLTDWQSVLAKNWTKIVFDRNPQNYESWFNNNLRKFILEFLKNYDNMSEFEKQSYKQFLSSIIT